MLKVNAKSKCQKTKKINGAYFSIYISYIHCLRTLNALFMLFFDEKSHF